MPWQSFHQIVASNWCIETVLVWTRSRIADSWVRVNCSLLLAILWWHWLEGLVSRCLYLDALNFWARRRCLFHRYMSSLCGWWCNLLSLVVACLRRTFQIITIIWQRLLLRFDILCLVRLKSSVSSGDPAAASPGRRRTSSFSSAAHFSWLFDNCLHRDWPVIHFTTLVCVISNRGLTA